MKDKWEKKEIRKERVYEERKGGNKWIKRETEVKKQQKQDNKTDKGLKNRRKNKEKKKAKEGCNKLFSILYKYVDCFRIN